MAGDKNIKSELTQHGKRKKRHGRAEKDPKKARKRHLLVLKEGR